MKKSLIAAASLVVCAGAQAQDGIQLYGIMDVAVGTAKSAWPASSTFPGTYNIFDKVASNAPSQTGLINGGIQHSRWGVKGSEDMGGGLKAFFQLESGFNLPTGALSSGAASLAANQGTTADTRRTAGGASAISGQLFGRGAFVGLESQELGRISFGRQTSIQYDQFGMFDPLGKADTFSPLGFSGTIGGGGGSTDNSRWDNSIKYKNTAGSFNYSAMMKLGGDTGSTKNIGGVTAQVGYDDGKLGLTAIFTQQNDAIITDYQGTANTTDIKGQLYNLKSYVVAGKYKLDEKTTLKAGWEHYERRAASTQGVSGTMLVYGFSTAMSSYSGDTKPYNLYFVGGDHNITDKLNLALGYYSLTNEAFTGNAKGHQAAYSVLADYRMSKRTDLYAGMMYVTFDEGALNPAGTDTVAYNKNNYIAAVGIRHKF